MGNDWKAEGVYIARLYGRAFPHLKQLASGEKVPALGADPNPANCILRVQSAGLLRLSSQFRRVDRGEDLFHSPLLVELVERGQSIGVQKQLRRPPDSGYFCPTPRKGLVGKVFQTNINRMSKLVKTGRAHFDQILPPSSNWPDVMNQWFAGRG